MAQYPVPQFIEREAKIAFFISFKQFFYFLIAGGICFVLYFILPLFLFVIAVIIVGGGAMSLGFVKVGGIPLPTILSNSFGFLAGKKSYIWKKEEVLYPSKVVKKSKIKKIEEEKPGLKIAQESKLKKLRSQVELRIK